MTIKEVAKVIELQRWPNHISDLYNYYFFLIFPLGIIGIGGSMFVSITIYNNIELLPTAVTISLLGLILLIFIGKRLYQNKVFEKYMAPGITNSLIEKAARSTDLKDVKMYASGYILCNTKVSGFSLGEEITIIPGKDFFLINSRPTGQPITLIRDRKNIKKMVEEINKATQNNIFG
jgi:hypothetical protein